MASVYKRGKTWSYRASYIDGNGVRHQPVHGGFRTKSLALEAARELEQKKSHGAVLDEETVSLPDYWDAWTARYKVGKHTLITEKRYPMISKTLRKHFGNQPLKTIRPSAWQDFLNEYGETHARESVSKLNSYVRSAVKAAINDQITYTDFTLGAAISGKRGKAETDKFLQRDQFEAVMNAAYDRADFDHVTSCIIYLGAVSGARYSEIIGLTWPDIDWDNNTIDINKTWDYHFKQGFLPTKTPSGVRKVRIPEKAMSMLRRLKAQQAAYYVRTGQRDTHKMVFRIKIGTIPTDAAANKVLKNIETAINDDPSQPDIPVPITFHGLRHSHVSYLLSKHVDIYYISKRLGHSDISITLSVYSHLLDDLQTEQEDLTIKALTEL